MKTKTITRGMAATALILSFIASDNASAANWLLLQGTEPAGSAGRAKLWGFIQTQYQKDLSDAFVTGAGAEIYNPPKLIGPELDSQEAFKVNRARIGVRGANFPLDTKTNYFILGEFGENGITHGNGGSARLTDASITLNHIPGARVRAGLFKYPGAEEGLQAIHVFDYINFTSVTNQLLLERYPQSTDTNTTPSTIPNAGQNQIHSPVNAFRDTGVQVFDAIKNGAWETSYAVMIGNGSGIAKGDNDDNKDLYLYLSTEKIFGGKGGRREGWKSFVWWQDGKRTNVYDKTQEQDRTRYGVGTKYLKKPFRLTAEYMKGKGMIFYGPARPLHLFNDLEASGGYIEGGYYIPNTAFEIDLRYDTYTRDENHPTSGPNDESQFDSITLGAQYHFNKKTRVNIEYSSRDFSSDTTAVNNQLDGVSGRFAIQLTAIY